MNPGLYLSGPRRAALAITLLAGAFILPVTSATADELDTLYSRVVERPSDSELNLRFAQLAENAGKLRWALSAYERVTLNDPGNVAAQEGMQRIRRKLQPSTTLLTVQLGAQYESNPNYYLGPRRSELQTLGSAVLLDERTFNGMRWRTNALAAGVIHQHEDQLNYGILGGDTGPVLDAVAGWSFRPAIGGNVAYFDDRFYYGEGALSGTFESILQGIYRSVTVRGAYRSYGESFPSQEGFYIEARGKLAIPNVIGPSSVAVGAVERYLGRIVGRRSDRHRIAARRVHGMGWPAGDHSERHELDGRRCQHQRQPARLPHRYRRHHRGKENRYHHQPRRIPHLPEPVRLSDRSPLRLSLHHGPVERPDQAVHRSHRDGLGHRALRSDHAAAVGQAVAVAGETIPFADPL